MKDSAFSKAAAALRDRYPGTSENALDTEARILARVRRRESGGHRRWGRWLPIAAVLAVSTAWADPGTLLPRVFRGARAWLGSEADLPRPAQRPPMPQAAPLRRAIETLPPAASAAPEGKREGTATSGTSRSGLGASVSRPQLGRLARPAPAGPEPNPSTPMPEPARPAADETELYRAAHRLHFGGATAEAALAAWNRYLEAVPHGAFVLEARYNRALTQMRLGLNREARNSLAPFARGEYGAYRQAEARALIEKLGMP